MSLINERNTTKTLVNLNSYDKVHISSKSAYRPNTSVKNIKSIKHADPEDHPRIVVDVGNSLTCGRRGRPRSSTTKRTRQW